MRKEIFLTEYLPAYQQFTRDERDYFFKVHASTESIAKKLSGSRLVFEDEKMIERWQYNFGQQTLTDEEKNFEYPEVSPNPVFQGAEREDGVHQTGGKPPRDFKLPVSNCPVPFQYLGYISCHDPIFHWLPFNLHLVFPIYAIVEKVFLDYSNPDQPIIINQQEVDEAENDIDLLDKNFQIEYQQNRIGFHDVGEAKRLDYSETGIAGIPVWQQTPFLPSCPKTGRGMQFVCQLAGGNPTKKHNLSFDGLDDNDREFWESEFDHLHFWGDGNLYVFFEPIAKTACIFIQGS